MLETVAESWGLTEMPDVPSFYTAEMPERQGTPFTERMAQCMQGASSGEVIDPVKLERLLTAQGATFPTTPHVDAIPLEL